MTSGWFDEASRRRRWLVGVSGGADSVALLHMMREKGFAKLVVCHLNHGLRGMASAGDAEFVSALAAELDLPVESGNADVPSEMRAGGLSMETAARQARHRFFGECARKYRCNRIVLAHHADDQAETVLWNLLRGSHGLRGMREIQNVGGLEFHRPLLGMRRTELRAWLRAEGIVWREDASNAEPVAVRNRLRNEVLPLLEEISGRDVAKMLVKAAAADEELRAVSRFAVAQVKALDPQGRIHLPVMRDFPEAIRVAVMAEFLQAGGIEQIGRGMLGRCLAILEPGGGTAVDLPGGRRLRRRAGRVFWDDAG